MEGEGEIRGGRERQKGKGGRERNGKRKEGRD